MRYLVLLLLSLLIGNAFAISLPAPPHFEKAPHSVVSLRINSLDSLSREILPEVLASSHLNEAHIPDQNLFHAQKLGYDIHIDLKDIVVQATVDSKNQVEAKFSDGDQLRLKLNLPLAQATAQISIALESHHFFAPTIRKQFKVKAQGVLASAALTLTASNGEIVAKDYTVEQSSVSTVDVQDAGVLESILNKVVSIGDLCGKDCTTLDQYLTKKVNESLLQFVQVQLLGSMKDQILAKLKTTTERSLALDPLDIEFQLKIAKFHTQGSSAILDWELWTQSKKPIDACASELKRPEESAPQISPSLTPDGDIEIAFSHSFFENIIYVLGTQGQLCSSGSDKAWRVFPYRYSIRPVDALSVQMNEEKSMAQVSANFSLDLDSHSFTARPIHSHGNQIAANATFLPIIDDKGFSIQFKQSAIENIQGKIKVGIFPINISNFQDIIGAELQAALEKNVGTINVIDRETVLNPFMKIRLKDQVRLTSDSIVVGIDIIPNNRPN